MEQSKIFGREQRLRTSTINRERPERGEEQEILRGKSDELVFPTPPQDDSTRDDAAEKKLVYYRRFHLSPSREPRVKLCMPREEAFPIPLKYIDVTRTTYTSLDVSLEKNVEDYWNVDGERELSDAWTGCTRFVLLNERPPDGFSWCGCESYEKTNNLKT